MNISSSNGRKQGFTLIELLVVIAIIAILAAILFPVFGRTRDNARRSTGISNVKQISLGILQYLQDYDERFFQTVTERQASLLPAPYTGPANPVTGTPGNESDYTIYSYRQKIQPYVKSQQIFKDPSGAAWDTSTSSANWSGWNPTDYGFHNNESKLTGGQKQFYIDNPSFGVNETHTLASIANGSKYILIGEAGRADGTASRGGLYPLNHAGGADPTKYYPFPGGPDVGSLDTQARPYKRHFDGVIFGYLDGHAKWVKPETTWAPIVASPGLNVNNQWSRDVQ